MTILRSVLRLFLVTCVLSLATFAQLQPNLENGFKRYGSHDGSNLDTVTLSKLTADGSTHQLDGLPSTVDNNGNATVYESVDTTGYHLALSGQDSNGVWNTVTLLDRQGNQYLGTSVPIPVPSRIHRNNRSLLWQTN